MKELTEIVRRPAPAGRPQPLAFHDGTLWIGCWDTSRLYAVDPQTWTVAQSIEAPGKPYGLASFGGALVVVVSIGEDDDRYLYRFSPNHGFDESGRTACPDLSGSHLATDGSSLFLLQMGNERIVVLDADGGIGREIALPTKAAGIGFDRETLYMISADEDYDVMQFGTLDTRTDPPKFTMLAPMAPEARALAFDGKRWWTNYRELGETVSFDA